MYTLKIRKQALKSFRKMPKRDATRLRNVLARLAEDPQSNDLDVVNLRGREGFRLRVGDWRIIFDRSDQIQEIEILRIGLRRDIYNR